MARAAICRRSEKNKGSCGTSTNPTRETAFGIFYTATIGGGALSPILYGFAGDTLGLTTTTLVIAAVVLMTLPLACMLNPMLYASGYKAA